MHRFSPPKLTGFIVALLALTTVVGLAYTVHLQASESLTKSSRALHPVPRSRKENEGDDLRTMSQRSFQHLAYPAGRIPSTWASDAKSYVAKNVADGQDLYPPSDGVIAPVSSTWTLLGPRPVDNNTAKVGFKYGLVTGRVNAVAFDPTNPAVAFAGAASGGLWKTTNCCASTTSWTSLWDDKDFVTQGVSAIEIDPTNHNVIYVGTGDADADDQFSQGIMKSIDGGATWTQLGANVFAPFAPGTPTSPNQNVASIKVDPRHPNTVIVGTLYGFFMSYNGGTSWTHYNITGIPTDDPERQRVTSILLDSSANPTQMYVAVGDKYSGYEDSAGVYKAAVPISGAPTFSYKTDSWYNDFGSGGMGRIRLAGSRGNTGGTLTIYAQVENTETTGALGTWVSRDGGANWTLLSGSDQDSYIGCDGIPTDEKQDFYDLALAVDPANDKILYIGRVSLHKGVVNNSYSGFASLTDVANVFAIDTQCGAYGKVHADQHAIVMTGAGKLLIGNDGGVSYNGSAGSVAGWLQLNNGLSTLQFYNGQLGNRMDGTGTQWAIGGMQDNGNASWSSTNSTKTWQSRGNGGDGFFVGFDPKAGTLTSGNWYTEYTYGTIACSTTGADGYYDDCAGAWSHDRADWAAPFLLDQVHCNASTCKNLVLGTNRVWATGTGGTTGAAWKAVSGDLTKVSGFGAEHTIIDVRSAASNPTAWVIGTDDGNVAWSGNAFSGVNCTQAATDSASFACVPNSGATWVKFVGGTAPLLPNRSMESVAFDPTSDKIIYAAVGGFNANTPGRAGHLFRASCASNCNSAAAWTWTNKSGNLPDVPADSVLVNPNNAKQVFVGTHFGFYYTNDITVAAPVWSRFQVGLPNTVIRYLTIDRSKTTLGAFTYGRGLYTIKLPGAAGFPVVCQDSYEPDNSAATATAYTLSTGVQTHYFCSANDQDWLKITSTANYIYEFDTLNLAAGVDTYLYLYDATGTNLITSNDNADATTKASHAAFQTASSGTYYLKVVQVGGAGDLNYRYDLKVTRSNAPGPCDPNGAKDKAAPAEPGKDGLPCSGAPKADDAGSKAGAP